MTLENLEESRRYHESRLNLLESIAERQQTLLEKLDAGLEEQKRYSANVHRLWVNLCRKYGWPEDEWLG